MKKIEYREARQEAIITQSLVELQDIWRHTGGVIVASDNHTSYNPNIFPALKYPTPLFRKVLLSNWQMWQRILSEFAMDLSSFKHPSFFEEKEFRIIRAILCSEGKYYDAGAGSRGGTVPVKERMRGSDKIPYIEFPIDANHEGAIVREVVLGPKNTEDVENLTIVFGLVVGLSACAAPYGYTDTVTPGTAITNPRTTGLSTMDPATTRHTPANTVRCNDVDAPFGLIVG